MALLSTTVRKSNLNVITDMIPEKPTMIYLDELTRQQQASTSRIYTNIALLDGINTRQCLCTADIDALGKAFPAHVGFFKSLPVTVSPSRSGLTDLTTYLHSVITSDIIKLVRWIQNNYTDVLPCNIEEATPVVTEFLDALKLIGSNLAFFSGNITTEQLARLVTVAPKSSSTADQNVLAALINLTNEKAREEYKFNFKVAKQQCQLAISGGYGSIAGLSTRLSVVKDIISKLTAAYSIPIWKKITSGK